MKQATKPFSALVQKTLEIYGKKKSISIITNKQSFAHGLICKDCGTIPFCKQCDVAIAYYKDAQGNFFGLCSYCKTQYPSVSSCQHCQGHDLDFYGYGAQQLADILKANYQLDPQLLDASKLNSLSKLERFQPQQITIASSVLTHPQKNCDILIIINADQGLQYPDYHARWMTFLQLYEAIMKHPGKQIILQSYHHEERVLTLAAKGALSQALATEKEQRSILSYPPFVDICLFLYKDEVEEKLFNKIQTLYQEILYLQEKMERKDIAIIATPPLIYKLHGKFRYTILFKGKDIRAFITKVYETLEVKKRWFMIDWMPIATI